MSASSTIAAVFVLVTTGAAFGQNREQPDFDFAGQDAARRAAEARFRDDQVRNQEAARLAQEQAVRELWWSRSCYLITAAVLAGCLFAPWYAAGAVLRRYERGRLAQGVFATIFAVFAIPLLAAWMFVAPDYALRSAAEPRIVDTGRPYPFNGAWEREEVTEQRVKEVREASRLHLAWRELPNLFGALAHAFRHQRGLVYFALLAEAVIAGAAVGLASRLGPVDQPKRRPMATRPKKVCENCGQVNGEAVAQCIRCNGVAFAPARPAAPAAEPGDAARGGGV